EVRQGTPGEMREDGGDRLAGMAVGGERDDLDLVVAGEEAQHLGAGIAAGAEDGDLHAMSCLQHVQSPDKKKGRPAGRPFWYANPPAGSALGELEAASGLRLTVLLALDDAAVARQIAARFEHRAQARLVIGQRLADAVAHRAGLTGEP